jgi:hypothetical protein
MAKLTLTPEEKQIGKDRVKVLKKINEDGVYDPNMLGRMTQEVFGRLVSNMEKAKQESLGESPKMSEAVTLMEAGGFEVVGKAARAPKKPIRLDSPPRELVNDFESRANPQEPTPESTGSFQIPDLGTGAVVVEPADEDIAEIMAVFEPMAHEIRAQADFIKDQAMRVAGIKTKTPKGEQVAKGIYEMLYKQLDMKLKFLHWALQNIDKINQ